MKTHVLLAFALLLGGVAFAAACPESLDWDAAPAIGRGMKYIHLTLDEPRRMENYLVRIDLRTPGLRVTSTGRASNWGAVMTDYTNEVYVIDTLRVRTRDFMEEHRAHGTNMVLALNTSPWGPGGRLLPTSTAGSRALSSRAGRSSRMPAGASACSSSSRTTSP